MYFQEFHSICDFKSKSKCFHLKAVCELETPATGGMIKLSYRSAENVISPHADESDCKEDGDYVSSTLNVETISTQTKVQMWQRKATEANGPKEYGSATANASDSVLSLKNCSSILHASGASHTIYKSCSPNELAKNIVRQTSTPMHHNVKMQSPDSMMCLHSVSSTSCQVSSIHSSNSSESDSSPTRAADAR